MGITAKELAEKLGISAAAVSMALNGKPGVSDETRRRIMEAAEQFGYDFTHVNRKKYKDGSIYFVIYKKSGVIVNDMPFFSQLQEGIVRGCQQSGYRHKVFYSYAGDIERRGINELKAPDCAGMIILATEMTAEDCAMLESLNTSVVLVDNYFDTLPCDAVLMNNVQGSYLATRYLIRKYRAQPGYLRSNLRINNFVERADGFYRAIREHGMSSSRSVVHALPPTVMGAYQDMEEILQRGDPLARCYFADNDLIAAGAAMALQDAGKSIPGDVALVGFDDMPVSTNTKPALTTVRVPIGSIGELAAHQLVRRIENPGLPTVRAQISVELIERESS